MPTLSAWWETARQHECVRDHVGRKWGTAREGCRVVGYRRYVGAILTEILMPRTLARIAAALVAPAALLLAPVSADAALPTRVSCISDEVVLTADNTHYELIGACGIVFVEADNATVTMSTATRLVVSGENTTVTAKTQILVEITGSSSAVAMTSARTLSMTGTGSSAAVTGLVERVTARADGTSLTADRTHVLVVGGTANVVDVRRGFRTRVIGDENAVTHRRLDRLRVRGDANTVTVAAGRTATKVVGAHNHVSVQKRR